MLDAVIATLPPASERRLMVACDDAGDSHDLIARLDKLAVRPGYQVIYAVGWDLCERERAAITTVAAHAWQITVDEHGEIRERRAEGVCGELDCGLHTCWVKEAHVTELASPLREASGRDQLADCRPPATR